MAVDGVKMARELRNVKVAAADRAAACATALNRLAQQVRSRWFDARWATDFLIMFSTDQPAQTTAAVFSRSHRLRMSPLVVDVARVAAADLAAGALQIIQTMQRDVYTRDQQARAAVIDKATNPNWQIVATVTESELAAVVVLPIEGRRLDEWLQSASAQWASELQAAIVRTMGISSVGIRRGPQAMTRQIEQTFTAWANRIARLAKLAGMVALHASAREFLAGLAGPAVKVA